MRIFYSPKSDLMVVESLAGFNTIHKKISEFFTSRGTVLRLDSDTSGNPHPYEKFLCGIVIAKSSGPIRVAINEADEIEIRGAMGNLEVYFNHFAFQDDEEGNHHHPEHVHKEGYLAPGSVNLIIEADTDWMEEFNDNQGPNADKKLPSTGL